MTELLLILGEILGESYKTLSSKSISEIIEMYEEYAPFDSYGIRALKILENKNGENQEEIFIQMAINYLKSKYKISVWK